MAKPFTTFIFYWTLVMEKKLYVKTFKVDETTEQKINQTVNEINRILGFEISQSSIIRRAIQKYDIKNDLQNITNELQLV